MPHLSFTNQGTRAGIRRRLPPIILTVIFCARITGCSAGVYMNDISQVSITSDSGTILPELQWHEQIVITKDRATLTRNGRTADTQVNAGTWEFAVDARKAAAMFAQLETVDCAAIKRIEPDDIPDGGGAASYTIVYGGSKQCSLVFDPGVTYTGGELVVAPIKAFIQSLTLPADAASRLTFSTP